MNETKHTDGPWVAENISGLSALVASKSDESVVAVVSGDGKSFEEMMANAQFIAAAPAMFEALRAIVEVAWNHGESYLEDARELSLYDKKAEVEAMRLANQWCEIGNIANKAIFQTRLPKVPPAAPTSDATTENQ